MLTVGEISLFDLPVWHPAGICGKRPTRKEARKWLGENKDLSVFLKTSYGTYGGLAVLALGLITSIAGYFKENKLCKLLGGILAFIGAGIAAVGKYCGIEYDLVDKVQNKVLFGSGKVVDLQSKNKNIENAEEISIETPDKETLKGYFLRAPVETKKTIIFLNGRGRNYSHCLDKLKDIQKKVPVNVLVVDYRGFGNSTGQATPEGVITDAKAMYDYLRNKGLESKDISVFGVSLGGAVAVELAKERPIDTLIIQSSFTAIEDIAKDKVAEVLPNKLTNFIAWLTKTEFNSIESIKNIKADKVIISHGEADEIIPFKQGKQLFDAVPIKNKTFIPLKGAKHRDFFDFCNDDNYYNILKAYIESDDLNELPKAA